MRHALYLVLILLAAGCSATDTDDLATATYVGTFAGGSSGALTVAVTGATATGRFAATARLAQPTLSGSFTASTGALMLSGGGYTFAGVLASGAVTGTWTGPGGSQGAFAAALSGGTAGEVTVYCGTFSGSSENGTFNLVRQGTALLGLAVGAQQGTTVRLDGTVSGTALTIFGTLGGQRVEIAQGAISGTTAGGTFSAGTNAGSWAGAVCTP